MSDTNTPAQTPPVTTPTVDNRPPEGTPEPDLKLSGSDDVPSSDKPDDIKRDLEKDPELDTLEKISKRLEEISAAFVKAKEEEKTILPGDVEAIAANKKLQQELAQEGLELNERARKLGEAANKRAQVPGNGGMRLSAPHLEHAWEKIMLLLEKLFELIKSTLRAVGIPIPNKKNGEPSKDGKTADKEADENTKGKPDSKKNYTPEQIAEMEKSTLGQTGQRLDAVKAENAKREAEAARNNDENGPGPKTPKL
jgi:hypothetical protein